MVTKKQTTDETLISDQTAPETTAQSEAAVKIQTDDVAETQTEETSAPPVVEMVATQDVEVTIGDTVATFKTGDSVSDTDRKIVSRLEQLGLLKEKE